ncbi:MAG: radical SAM protein [Planctomycetaceae bacterium]|nr:radical SAM protein [Planctomycetaceae bacterium]
MTRTEYKFLRSAFARLRYVELHEDGKIAMPYLETYLTRGCNLKCDYCSHHNPFRSGVEPQEVLLHSFEEWGKRLKPEKFALLGGEPLLHPNFAELVLAARKHFPDSVISITTNGLLLPKISGEALESFNRADRIVFLVSDHLGTPQFKEMLDRQVKRFKPLDGVSLTIEPFFKRWKTLHLHNENGEAIPANSDPKTAFRHCHSNLCRNILGDKLSFCSVLTNTACAYNEGAIRKEWKIALSHKPMTLTNTQEEIFAYIEERVQPVCSMCPGHLKSVEPKQLSLEEVRRIKKAA